MKHCDLRAQCRPRTLLLAAVAVLTGCAAGGPADTESVTADVGAFRDQLALTTQAINAGALDEAKMQLSRTRATVRSPRQVQKVDDLHLLIVGAEAMRAGDPVGARTAWAQIEEPHLRREVRHKARLIGLEVPMEAVDEGASP